jgi:hypothetical protein
LNASLPNVVVNTGESLVIAKAEPEEKKESEGDKAKTDSDEKKKD